jgi:hypothetical protein
MIAIKKLAIDNQALTERSFRIALNRAIPE